MHDACQLLGSPVTTGIFAILRELQHLKQQQSFYRSKCKFRSNPLWNKHLNGNYLRSRAHSNGYPVTEKMRQCAAKFFLFSPALNCEPIVLAFGLSALSRSLTSHDFAALAQECRNVQVILLKVRHHRVAHGVE